MNSDIKISKFISLILRHQPDKIGIKLDEHGWADVRELISGINKSGKAIDMEMLERIVSEDDKQRYSFNADCTKIRANQGHSVKVDVELKECQPPDVLYHGTAERFISSIKAEGIKSKSRLYVHLSSDESTAVKVGSRHGAPRVLLIDAAKMYVDGFRFYLSENGVWLTENVPAEYLRNGR